MLTKFTEFLYEAKEVGTPTSDVHKHVSKIMKPKQIGGVLKGIKHHVEHHEDGSSTVHIHHDNAPDRPRFGQAPERSQTSHVVSFIDHVREGHRNEHNHTPKEVLNGKTKSHKDGYSAYKNAPHVDIHSESKADGHKSVTKVHFKPSKEHQE